MSKPIIVFISEGEKTEKKVINNIKRNFFNDEDKDIIFLSFKTDIYQLYKQLKEDDFETDIIEVLIEKNPQVEKTLSSDGRDKKSISQIFLFFDYDGYAFNGRDGENGDDIIREMIEVFDNETVQGKIYVSYPMVEAIRDLQMEDYCWRRCSVMAKVNINYKKLVTDCNQFTYLGSYTKDHWNFILKNGLKKANCIVSSSFSIPSYSIYQSFISQLGIFNNQIDKFISIDATVAVLSGFPFFLIDYFGENLYKQFESTD